MSELEAQPNVADIWENEKNAAERAAEERVFQYYSLPMFERLRVDLEKGKLWARMQAERLYRVIMADDEFQKTAIGNTYAAERETLLKMRKTGWILCAVNAVLSIAVLWDLAPFYLPVAAYYFSVVYKRARADSKDRGVYWLASIIVVLFSIWKYRHPAVVCFAVYTAFVFVWPYIMFGRFRQICRKLLLTDYRFFKYATGRQKDLPDRPPITLIKKTEFANATVSWDINPAPALTDLQIDSPYPTLIGRSYEFYFSRYHVRVIAFFMSWALALWTPKALLWIYAAGLAVALSLLYCSVCPSQQFMEYRFRRDEVGNLGDTMMTYGSWFCINSLWTFICFTVIGYIIQDSLPIVMPHIKSQLDGSFPHWRYIARSIMEFLSL